METINSLLKTLFYGFCDCAMWLFAFKMLAEMLKSASASDYHATIKTLVSGGISYACMYAIVKLLESIKIAMTKVG